ncbi:MAG: hypothetical protein HY709_09900 [Candidatus Latescibacteria bacterium]|nr:hypothetical protein [Candidatus Latescibacterota bacterium]
MAPPSDMYHLLEQATAVLPVSDEDLISKGIATALSERMLVLKKAMTRLHETYGSLEDLENTIQTEGVSSDDHTRYTDLLEWRAIRHELTNLLHILETMS